MYHFCHILWWIQLRVEFSVNNMLHIAKRMSLAHLCCWHDTADYEVCVKVKIYVLSQISISIWFLPNMYGCFPAILWTKSFCEDYNAIAGYQDRHKRNTERKLIVCRFIFYIYQGILGLRPLDPSARLAWITSSFPLRERSSLPTQSVTYGQTASLRTSLLDVKTA